MKKMVLLLVFAVTVSCLWTTAYGEGASKEPVRMAYLQGDIHHLPLWVALDKGFFNKRGVKVTIAGIFKAGPELMSGFSAGALDMGYVGGAPTVTAVANGTAKVRIVAQVNAEGSAIVVGKNSDIASIRDLAKAQIAIPGYSTVQDFLLQKALGKYGIDLKTVRIIVLKPAEMIGALRTGQIDAFIAWEPYPAKAVNMGVGRILIGSGEIWKDHPCCVLAADSVFAEKNREKMEKVLDAHTEAIEFIHKNPDEAMEIAAKYTGMDQGTIRDAMRNVKYTHNINIEGLKEYAEFLRDLGYIKISDPDAFIKNLVH
jgi:NitT/TauT family transport system substrate-binding protein